MIVGPAGMDPRNIGWAGAGDSATHYLGWWFFRDAPWTMPLGTNLGYGLELGSSIFYSDSIPLCAFLLKPLSSWLPDVFQYLGLWTALCIVLQALFAWLLLGRFVATSASALRLFAAGVFVFSPVMMIRISGHSALVAQWLILAALYLYFGPVSKRRLLAWPGLVLTASLVHSYLFVIVLSLWAADLLQRWPEWKTRAPRLALEGLLVVLLPLFGLWQAGFFMVKVGPAGGYGEYGTNLLGLINPDIYSHVIEPLAPPYLGFHEGYAFLGLGCLILLPLSLLALLQRPAVSSQRRLWPLLVVLIGLSVFAVSNHVALGALELTIELPRRVSQTLSILRSSGRMFWPTYYVVMLAIVVLAARSQSQRVAFGAMALAFVVQVVDTSEGWTKHRAHFAASFASTWPTPLLSPFWDVAGKEYRRLRSVPLVHHAPDYAMWASYAARHHMTTDSAYLARVNPRVLLARRLASEEAILLGDFERDTLYVLDRKQAALAADSLDADADLLASVDGFYVLAPGWKQRESTRALNLVALSERALSDGPERNEVVAFNAGAAGVRLLRSGWSSPESWGVWSERAAAVLSLPLRDPAEVPTSIDIEVGALIAKAHPSQVVECWVNGVLSTTLRFDASANTGWRRVEVPPAAREKALRDRSIEVELKILDPANPKRLGINEDTRDLGIALHRLRLR